MYKCIKALVLTIALLPGVVLAEDSVRDPTKPLGRVKTTNAPVTLVLQAVFKGSGRNTAVINGKTLKEGDSVAGATVVKIKDKSVIYSRAGSTGTIYLRPKLINPITH